MDAPSTFIFGIYYFNFSSIVYVNFFFLVLFFLQKNISFTLHIFLFTLNTLKNEQFFFKMYVILFLAKLTWRNESFLGGDVPGGIRIKSPRKNLFECR